MTRCQNPSVWWIHLGSYGGSGWCVCNEHRPFVLAQAPKVAAWPGIINASCRALTPESGVLTTVAGERENRKQCQWDPDKHAVKSLADESDADARAAASGEPSPIAGLLLACDEVLEAAEYPFRTSREKISHDELRHELQKVRGLTNCPTCNHPLGTGVQWCINPAHKIESPPPPIVPQPAGIGGKLPRGAK